MVITYFYQYEPTKKKVSSSKNFEISWKCCEHELLLAQAAAASYYLSPSCLLFAKKAKHQDKEPFVIHIQLLVNTVLYFIELRSVKKPTC